MSKIKRFFSVQTVESSPNGLKIQWENVSTPSLYHFSWLRDHCRCSKCFHPGTQQKLTQPIVSTKFQDFKLSNKDLVIDWTGQDGPHSSIFELDFLKKYDYSASHKNATKVPQDCVIWGKLLINYYQTS